MPASDIYRRQVALLVRVIPLVAQERDFALKGGTAINLFVRDMPRLSVDIDLVYLPVAGRAHSLTQIDAGMKRIAVAIARGIRGARVQLGVLQGENCVTKLFVRADDVQVKLEITPVLRGCVYEPGMRTVCRKAEEEFGFAEMQVVSFEDLYAGKIVAALDRQHPRDLFDVRDLLANEGINHRMRKAFIIYLLSHDRPMAEILCPSRRDMAMEYTREFSGMTETNITLDELARTREALIDDIVGNMPPEHRQFLVSVKRGNADWRQLNLPHIENLPAVRWKLQNLNRLTPQRRSDLLRDLSEVLHIEYGETVKE